MISYIGLVGCDSFPCKSAKSIIVKMETIEDSQQSSIEQVVSQTGQDS